MIIEITKKNIIAIVAVVSLVLCSVIGYALYSAGLKKGYSAGYEEGHSSGVKETELKYENPMGDGSVWYVEAINNGRDNLYHSTSKCPYIRNGININWGFTDHNYRKQHSLFCSKCMNAYLVNACKEYLYTDRDWN